MQKIKKNQEKSLFYATPKLCLIYKRYSSIMEYEINDQNHFQSIIEYFFTQKILRFIMFGIF